MDTTPAQAQPETGAHQAAQDQAQDLPVEVAARLEQLIRLFRRLSPPSGLSLTAAATLATLERSGPCRLTSLAMREGVTQPAMTQLIARLQDEGLVTRDRDSADRRVVQVDITEEGRTRLSRRRAFRAERLAVLLNRLGPEQRAALAGALAVIELLVSTSDADIAEPELRVY
jgi:DNA-binding MarR family transcriptional regulator